MNKLISPVFNKKSWGSEIIWTLTDHYMAKTIEIDSFKITDLLVYEKKEKSIIVVGGLLSLALGKCCDENELKYYDCPEGWSVYIGPGYMHRYGATDKQVRVIEISSPEIDEAVLVKGV